MRGLFFTGTDTDVGKTYVVSAVARLLKSSVPGLRVFKPVATGGIVTQHGFFSEDTLALADAIGVADQKEELRRITPWTFEPPLAPPVAAKLAGEGLDVEAMAQAVEQEAGEMALVEGVGGLLCPLTETDTIADLARRLALPLIVVTRRSLGTLNHTLLTLEVAEHRNLKVAGVIVNETTPPDSLAEKTNVEELNRRCHVPILGVVPYHPDPPPIIPELAAIHWQGLAAFS